jgi:hypothetical protein
VIARVNAAHIMLARGTDRSRELAIRLALGAGRSPIVRELLVESVALACASALLAVPLAWLGLWLADSPLGLPIGIDTTLLALSVATGLATTLIFGIGPALRVSNLRPSSTLGIMGVRDQASPARSRTRRALLIGEVALSIALMGTAWQLVATVRSQAVTGGVAPERLLLARFDLTPCCRRPPTPSSFGICCRRPNGCPMWSAPAWPGLRPWITIPGYVSRSPDDLDVKLLCRVE